jgi:hypothetical protein
LARHLTFLLVGVAVIFGLSEVSKQVGRLRGAAAMVEVQHLPAPLNAKTSSARSNHAGGF